MSLSNIPCLAFTSAQSSGSSGGAPFNIGNLVLSATGLTAARTFTFPDQSDTVTTTIGVQTFTNKTIDAGLNPHIQLYQSPLLMRTGGFESHSSTTTGGFLDGALANHTITPSSGITQGWDTTYGLYTIFTSGASSGNLAGITSPTAAAGIARTNFATRIGSVAAATATTSIRRVVGFSSNVSAWPPSNTDVFLGAGDSGIAVGYRSSDTTWQIFNNDGSGAMVVTPVSPTINTDAAFHTVSIQWPAGGASATVTVDGNVQTPISTRLPAITTNLGYSDCIETATTAGKTMWLHATFFESQH